MIKRSNGIQDAGVPLVVDPFTRKVTVPASERVIGVVGDHCSEQVTFSLPRSIDNHDMTTCTRAYIAWRNVDGEPGDDELDITEAEGDRILAKWVIRDRVALTKGLVSFSLHFECWDADGKLIYKWGTHTCSECEILDSVNARLGAYAAIYIDGETLVFADYTPVHDGKLDLASCVLPTDTLEIHTEGEYDVGEYAYAKVAGLYENPSISLLGGGVVSATANGREGRYQLDAPTISVGGGKVTAEASGLTTRKAVTPADFAKMTRIKINHPNDGFVMYRAFQADGGLVATTLDLSTEPATELDVLAGSTMEFITGNNTPAAVEIVGHPLAVYGTASHMAGFISSTLVTVPVVADGEVVEINMQ